MKQPPVESQLTLNALYFFDGSLSLWNHKVSEPASSSIAQVASSSWGHSVHRHRGGAGDGWGRKQYRQWTGAFLSRTCVWPISKVISAVEGIYEGN